MKLKDGEGFESHEIGVLCQDNGYCHTFNVVGGTSYAIVKSVERFPDKCEIDADAVTEFGDGPLEELHFTLYPADNKFGYTLRSAD